MTAIENTGPMSEPRAVWMSGFCAPVALEWTAEETRRALLLRDMDDTEDSDEEEDEALEEDAEEEEPDSDVLWTAEPNAVHGHGKPSREEIEEELEEMEKEEDGEGGDLEPEKEEEEKEEGQAKVDKAIDSALRMNALTAVVSEFASNTRDWNPGGSLQ